MEIYFYCSYEHSKRGFFLTRLEEDGLVPAEDGGRQPPEVVWEFFSYDRYRFLWRDLCPPVDKLWQRPQCTGGFCGLRSLRGTMADGRSGTVNLVFLAGPEEALLRRTALSILADYSSFQSMIFSWLSVGEPCGYQLNVPAFRDWLRRCGSAGQLRRLVGADSPAARLLPGLQRTQPPRLERDTLRLAVCTCTWEEIYESMGGRLIWRRQPRCAITEEQFDAAFARGPVWTLEGPEPPKQ